MVPGALHLPVSLPCSPERVALVRALQLGDLLCAVPALRALRAALPTATFTLVGLPWARTLLDRYPHYLDDFMAFPGEREIPERDPDDRRREAFFTDAEERRFDLAIQMHGDGSIMNGFTAKLGARAMSGFCRPGAIPEQGRFLSYPDGESEVQRLLRLAEFLGAPSRSDHLEFPLFEDDEDEAARLRAQHGLGHGRYACLHPGGRGADRRWEPAGFAAVGEALAAGGIDIAITGTEEEQPIAEAVARRMSLPTAVLAGRTTLGGLAALLSGSRLLLANDTGVSHLAAALRVPSVIIFTGSDPQRWAPADGTLHRPMLASAGEHVDPKEVVEAAEELMEVVAP